MKRTMFLAWVALVGVLAGACGDDSREIQPPEDQMTTTAPSTSAAEEPAGAGDAAGVLELTTSSFTPGEVVPVRYTCQGDDVSPALSWTNLPEGTQEMVVLMRDLDATVQPDGGAPREFVHWVIGGIDPAIGELAEGEVPDDAEEPLNDFGEQGWRGPCPPEGSGDHVYEFRIYAMAEPLNLVPDLQPDQSVALIEGANSLGSAAFMGTVTG